MKSYGELNQNLQTSETLKLAILPTGCYEQHGPVLPLDTDNLIAQGTAERLAQSLSPWFCHVFPCLPYSTTEPNRGYAGTVNIEADPFRAYFRQVCCSILESDFDALLVLNSHGSVVGSLKEIGFEIVMQQFRSENRPIRPVLCCNAFDFDSDIAEVIGMPVGRHADWKEFLLVYGLLGEEYFTAERLESLQQFSESNDFNTHLPRVLGIPAQHRTVDGVQGEPLPNSTNFSELSHQVWDITINSLTKLVREELVRFQEEFANRPGVDQG